MICSRCGNRLEPDALFCSHCGSRIVTRPYADHTNSTAGDLSTPSQKFESPYRAPLLTNGVIAIVCGLAAMFLEATTHTSGSLTYLEKSLLGYSDYEVLINAMHRATDICKLWLGVGVIFIIVGFLLPKRKNNKKNASAQTLLWILPMLATLLIAAFDVVCIVWIITY